ncbi:RelA/SpoT family protein [Patescibacteria group bacterium]
MTPSTYKEYFDIEELTGKIKTYLPNFHKESFISAFNFAERAHRGQLRKDNKTPYIAHPVAVTNILSNLHADQDVLMSALMHDVPEDTHYSIRDVEKQFGKKIAFIINGITKLSKVYYRNNMSKRSIESLKKLFLHCVEDPRVILIKLADRLHNMKTLDAVDSEKQVRIARETLEIYVPIANLLGIQLIRSKLENLCFKFLYPQEYWLFKERVENIKQVQNRVASETTKAFTDLLAKHSITAEVKLRNYNLYCIYKTINESGLTAQDIDDRIRIRIIVDKTTDCYLALGLIHSKFKPKKRAFKDYIANPKFNTYQSLHTSIFGIDGILTEVQIASKEMIFQSHYGIAAHFFSQDKDFNGDERSNWVNNVVEMEKIEQNDHHFMENLKREILQEKILVFTPKGDTIYLPCDSSVLDFAYAIHTEIGKHAYEARVNGNKKNITDTLATNDVVKVTTSQNSHPKLNWLSFVKTTHAKENIKHYLRRESQNMKIEQGRALLQKEFDLAALGVLRDMDFKRIQDVIQKTLGRTLKNWKEVFITIGEGDINAINLVKNLDHPKKYSKYSFSRYLRNRTLKKGLKITVKIIGKNEFGQLGNIAKVFYKYSLDIWSFKAHTSPLLTYSYFIVQTIVDDIEKVIKLFDELEQRDDVYVVRRINSTGIFVLIAMIICILAMIALFYLDQKTFFALKYFNVGYDYIVIISNLLILLLFFGNFQLNKILKVYSPSIRNHLAVKIFLQWLPIVLMGVLVYEFFYYFLFTKNTLQTCVTFGVTVIAIVTYYFWKRKKI